MNKKFKLLAITGFLFNIYCAYANIDTNINLIYEGLDSQQFIETTATIKPFTCKEEETSKIVNAYIITYYTKESNEKIVQYIFPNDNSIAKPQEVKIKYKKIEPIMFYKQKKIEVESN